MKRLFPLLLLAFASCSPAAEDKPAVVSVIGAAPGLADPNDQSLSFSSATLLGAIGQGLVRFDGGGQIEPGLAIRWDVSDDGLYYTFRIADGLAVDAELAAKRLNGAIRRASRNPLKPVLGAIEEVVAVTPEVIEVRMIAPRPNLLQLFAQPELAMIGDRGGTGPMMLAGREGGALLLKPVPSPESEGEADEEELPHRRSEVLLRGERAALAVARFAGGGSDAVIGGRFADLPIARAAGLSPRALRFDPVAGLFGLAIVDATGFLASVEGRRALSMAIDRAELARLFARREWNGQERLLPPGLDDLPSPAAPDWIDTDLAQRRSIARGSVGGWAQRTGAPPLLRVALPSGPGASILFALLRANWGAIGVEVVQVPYRAAADLRLIDEVAPADIASWYLRRFACVRSKVCSEEADAMLEAARIAPTLAQRSAFLAEADRRFAEITPFIPLAAPMRWSLVSPRVPGWRENSRGVHPLNHLRDPLQ